MANKSSKKRGTERMKENGMRAVTIWVSPAEWEVLKRLSEQKGQRLATYVRLEVLAPAMVLVEARQREIDRAAGRY